MLFVCNLYIGIWNFTKMFGITYTTPNSTFSNVVIETPDIGSPIFTYLIIAVVVIAILVVVLYYLRQMLWQRHHERHEAFEKIVLLVTLPKEAAEADNKGGEGLQKIQETIGTAETFFSSIAGLKASRGFKAWWLGREDHFAFEIVAKEGLVYFYIVTPRKLQDFIEQQLHAQFSGANIEEVEDYNIFHPQGVVVGTFLSYKKMSALPIKTYRKLDSDPLNAITNSLSKVPVGDGAAIQYVVRSAKSDWRKRGVKIASAMQQGKKFKEAARASGGMGAFFDKLPIGKGKKNDGPPKEHRLTPLEEEMVKSIEEKSSKLGLDVGIRIVVSSQDEAQAKRILDGIVGAYYQYNSPQYGNTISKKAPSHNKLVRDFIYRNFDEKRSFVANVEEFASLFHFPLLSSETPNIKWLVARKAPAPTDVPKEGLLLGYVKYRGEETKIHIKQADRRRHFYIIGRSGSGKTVLMENMVVQDIKDGKGVGIIDPHGEFVEYVLEHIPKERAEDVIVFDPSDYERPMGLNMLEFEGEDQKDMAVQEMVDIFYKLFPPEMIGPMFEHVMRNAMLTLMSDPENPGTLAEIPRILTDPDYQKYWVAKVTDPVVRAYWEKEVAKTSDFHKSEMFGYLTSKVGRFVENTAMRNIIGQQRSGFNIRKAMDEKKILLMNLSKGKTGDVNAKLLGLILVSKIQMAALARADTPEEQRHDFYLYIDEFQNFITPSIATILSEARKYKLNLIMAHQYMGQLIENGKTEIRDAILGNAGTIASYRIGVEDAEVLEKEFKPVFNAYDLVNADKYTAYVKLLIDNTASKPFNMCVYPPQKGDRKLAEAIKQLSRLKNARPRDIVEAEILERSALGETGAKQGPPTGESLGR